MPVIVKSKGAKSHKKITPDGLTVRMCSNCKCWLMQSEFHGSTWDSGGRCKLCTSQYNKRCRWKRKIQEGKEGGRDLQRLEFYSTVGKRQSVECAWCNFKVRIGELQAWQLTAVGWQCEYCAYGEELSG